MEGNLINTINLSNEGLLLSYFIQYKSNILLNFCQNVSNYFSFYVFSSDFKNYGLIDKIGISKIISKNVETYTNIIPIFSFKKEKCLKLKIIKY